MFGREPAVVLGALSEIIKAVIPMLIIFGFIQWTSEQVAQVMIVVGVIVGGLNIVLTRSQVRPEADVNALIRTAIAQPAGTRVETVKDIQAAKDEGTRP
jgi:hypothetical protein